MPFFRCLNYIHAFYSDCFSDSIYIITDFQYLSLMSEVYLCENSRSTALKCACKKY